MLRRGVTEPAHSALHSQPGINLEPCPAIGENQLHGRATFPIRATHHGVSVNSITCAEESIHWSHNAYCRNCEQRIDEAVTRQRPIDNGGGQIEIRGVTEPIAPRV